MRVLFNHVQYNSLQSALSLKIYFQHLARLDQLPISSLGSSTGSERLYTVTLDGTLKVMLVTAAATPPLLGYKYLRTQPTTEIPQ